MCSIKVIRKERSKVDDVTKYILEDDVFGKNEVSVIQKRTKTVFCLPTQTNCKMGCTFCHLTGTSRPSKNLSSDWVSDVVELLLPEADLSKVLLISFMGAGEPLLNVSEITWAIELLYRRHRPNGVNIRFAFATTVPSKDALLNFIQWAVQNKTIQIKVHLSVHGTINRKRLIKATPSIEWGISACDVYSHLTGNPVEYHYTLVEGTNDSLEELTSLSKMIKGNGSTIKFLSLSEYNGCKKSGMGEKDLREIFANNPVEFYDPPGRDVGSSCGMFDQSIYNEEMQ